MKKKVLVAKAGKEEVFQKRLTEVRDIQNGKLDWYEMDDMMNTLGDFKDNGLAPSTREESKEFITEMFMSALNEVSEWVTEEEAERRNQVKEVLYSESAKVSTGK